MPVERPHVTARGFYHRCLSSPSYSTCDVMIVPAARGKSTYPSAVTGTSTGCVLGEQPAADRRQPQHHRHAHWSHSRAYTKTDHVEAWAQRTAMTPEPIGSSPANRLLCPKANLLGPCNFARQRGRGRPRTPRESFSTSCTRKGLGGPATSPMPGAVHTCPGAEVGDSGKAITRLRPLPFSSRQMQQHGPA